jgi:predicted ATPase
MQKNDERFYEAEIYRVKGDLLLQSGGAHCEAEACFRRAIDVAGRQNTRMLELRAITSLSRLWKNRGKSWEARQLLRDICHRFSEGFDTADFRDAMRLLNELNYADMSRSIKNC